jgi:hypothetical protein
MKIKLYYVVRPFQPGPDSIDRDSDGFYVAGPYQNKQEAMEYVEHSRSANLVGSEFYQVAHVITKVLV